MRYTANFVEKIETTLKENNLYDSFTLTEKFTKHIVFEILNIHSTAKPEYGKARRVKYYNRYLRNTAMALLVIQHKRDGKSAKNIDAGYVYAITSPRHSEIKIGETIDVVDRLRTYQTYCPSRSFYIIKYAFSFNRKLAESTLKESLNCDYEWTSLPKAVVISEMKKVEDLK